MDFWYLYYRGFLECEYMTYENFLRQTHQRIDINPYVIDEEEGEMIIYAESPEDAVRRFLYINGYTDR